MRLEHYPIETLRSQIRKVVGRYLDLNQYDVFFFGSRVSGAGSERSDIDIGILGRTPVPRRAMAKIREELEELPTLYTLQIVDFARCSDEFRAVALSHTEPIG